MFHETTKAGRSEGQSAKVYAVAAAIVAGWLMMFGGVIASVHAGPSLQGSIETVLSARSPSQPAPPVTFAQR